LDKNWTKIGQKLDKNLTKIWQKFDKNLTKIWQKLDKNSKILSLKFLSGQKLDKKLDKKILILEFEVSFRAKMLKKFQQILANKF
jgi:hypothetical protein